MLQVIGENQKQLAEIMKGVVEPLKLETHQVVAAVDMVESLHLLLDTCHSFHLASCLIGTAMPPLAPIRAKFWQYQPVVAPNMEPNESRNPPSAAYAAQECPAKNPGGLEVLDESGNQRTVGPTARSQEQIKTLNASYVPKGWMQLPSGSLHRIYA